MVALYLFCFWCEEQQKIITWSQSFLPSLFPTSLSLLFPIFNVLCLSLIHANFCQIHHSVWVCVMYECVHVCLLLIKSRANVAAHTKAWQRQGNLSICRHGMVIKSHPSDWYWQEQIGLGKQRQLGCAHAHLFVSVCIYVDAPILEWCAVTGEVKKSSPVIAGKAMANWV